jgi:hypothetical protein
MVSFEKSIVFAFGYATVGLLLMYLTFMSRDVTD